MKDMKRSLFEGIGKPKARKANLSGYWSGRIDEANHIVYGVKDEALIIISCKGHYD